MAGEASEWGFTKCITGVKSTSVLFSKRGRREGSSGGAASHHRRFFLMGKAFMGGGEGGEGGRQMCVRWNREEMEERRKEGLICDEMKEPQVPHRCV